LTQVVEAFTELKPRSTQPIDYTLKFNSSI